MKKTSSFLFARDQERKTLEKLLCSKKSEFIALYGRRRVGKTYFLRHSLKEYQPFDIFGQKDASKQEQLSNFILSFQKYFGKSDSLAIPKSWNEAFELLTKEVRQSKKIFVFWLDELPWLCGRKSGCYQALDYFWNKEWSHLPNFKLIVCGSSAAWMIDHIINAKGGLHNRLTFSMQLKPFSLSQTAEYLLARKFRYTIEQVIRLQLCFGGIPYYLSLLDPSLSDSQNIDQLCYRNDSPLFYEFEKVFESLFDHHQDHEKIVQALAQTRQGMTVKQLLEKTGLSSGGTFNKRLMELEKSNFVLVRTPVGRKKKESVFFLSDEYSLFYLTWVRPIKKAQSQLKKNQYWSHQIQKPEWFAWAGYSFETLVFKNFDWVQDQLQIQGLVRNFGPLKMKGAQLDLLLERTDNVVQILEIKYYQKMFEVTKEYSFQLKNKIQAVHEHYKGKKQVLLTIITLNGWKQNAWSYGLVDSHVALKDLFIRKIK